MRLKRKLQNFGINFRNKRLLKDLYLPITKQIVLSEKNICETRRKFKKFFTVKITYF